MNQTEQKKKWYQKKRYIGLLILGAIFIGSNSSSTNSVSTIDPSAAAVKSIAAPAVFSQQSVSETAPSYQQQSTSVEVAQPTADTGLSNNNYYTNSDGNEVHSPAYSESVPSGATAQCGDGTYSFSQSRRGTCSHHGGVATWNP